jgi:iron complex outermembrane receptor protein
MLNPLLKAARFILIFVSCLNVYGQEENSYPADSSRILEEVTIEAYEYDRPLREIPAAIGFVGEKDFERFNNNSLLPAINTVPGVRVEERSPGSYRLSIRGSTLRSPFGIRNVKVYWNGMPFTDPGGNTYLNLLDNNSVEQAEIIKGPGSSLYGAGTGGALLLKSPKPKFNKQQIRFASTGGSFGLFRYSLGVQSSTEKHNTNVQFAHQQSEGYREQSGMERNVIQVQGNFNVDKKRILSGNLFYAHLNYQTPGGLTKDQYDQDPKQARPAGGPNRGAVEQKAAVDNKTFYGGVSQEYIWNARWSNRTGLYGTFTQFENPSIRNVERRIEQSFGGRSVTQYHKDKFKFNFGGEFQSGFSPIKTYTNNFGKSGLLITDDEISSTTGFIFLQTDFVFPHNFYLTLGSSLNFATVKFTRLSIEPRLNENRNFSPVISPRLSLLKKILPSISIYGSFSQGFSPPTVAEIYPSSSVFDKTLDAEKGNNYEAGIRGTILDDALTVDLTAYTFQLKNAITLRRKDDGAEYFVNSGNTLQNGLELSMAWTPGLMPGSFVDDFKLWASYTYNDYRFKNYKQDSLNISGNSLTGVAPHILVAGLDISLRWNLYYNITLNYGDRIPLDDINSEFSDRYSLLGFRTGYRKDTGKVIIDVFWGIENLFDQRYSLGNDLNAPAKRFYNAAAGRNYFVGMRLGLGRIVNR